MLALQKLKEYAATDRTAIIHRGLRLSYREPDECSDTIAPFLLRQFGDAPTPVVIGGNKSWPLCAAPWARSKAAGPMCPSSTRCPPNAPAASCRLSSPR